MTLRPQENNHAAWYSDQGVRIYNPAAGSGHIAPRLSVNRVHLLKIKNVGSLKSAVLDLYFFRKICDVARKAMLDYAVFIVSRHAFKIESDKEWQNHYFYSGKQNTHQLSVSAGRNLSGTELSPIELAKKTLEKTLYPQDWWQAKHNFKYVCGIKRFRI